MSEPAPPPPPPYGGFVPELPFAAPEAIAWGWRKFRLFLGPVMVGVAIYIAFGVATQMISGASSIATGFISGDNPFDQTYAENPFTGAHIADSVIQLIVGVAAAIGGLVLKATAARASLDVADGRIYDFVNAFRRIPIAKLIGAQLLLALLGIIAAMLIVMVGVALGVLLHAPTSILVVLALVAFAAFIAAALFVFFTPWVLVDDPSTSVVSAITTSITLVRTNVGDALLLAVLNVLVSIAGFLACCVGLIVAYPVTTFAVANAFRRFRGQSVVA